MHMMNSQTTHNQHNNPYLYAIRECSNYATIIQFLPIPFNFIDACNLLRPYTLERLAITNFSFKLKSNIDRVVTLFHRTLENVDISQGKNIRDTDISPFNMCKKLKSVKNNIDNNDGTKNISNTIIVIAFNQVKYSILNF